MKRLYLLLTIGFYSCQNYEMVNLSFVLDNYFEQIRNIETIEYAAHQLDTIESANVVLNNTGYVLLEREPDDDIHGYSFFAKVDSSTFEYLYDEGIGFEIIPETKSYEITCSAEKFLGSPGGQLVTPFFFRLDTLYENIELFEEDDKYLIKYDLTDNSEDDDSYYYKFIALDKKSYLPIKLTTISSINGIRLVRELAFSNIKINEQVLNTIESQKNILVDFEQTQKEPRQRINLNRSISQLSLKDMNGKEVLLNLKSEKLTLIDFWEVWCGPCVKSLLDIESIKNNYGDRVNVVGIVSQDINIAQSLLIKKSITFDNYLSSGQLNSDFNITSYPTYLLIDRNGRVINEYFGFDKEQIENDIKNYL